MRGGAAPSFVRHLKEHEGYQMLTTIGTGSSYFNSRQAYQSLGVDQVVFLEESDDFKRDPHDAYIFDGDVFDFHLHRLKQAKAQSHQPIVNYIVGMYGHTPFFRNKDKRPDHIRVEPHHDEIHLIANQFYYRTQALGNYLSQLSELDPHAVIYITSDHLPPVISSSVTYQKGKMDNISLLRVDNESVDVSGKSHNQIPRFIWGNIISKYNKRVIPQIELERCYFDIISKSFLKNDELILDTNRATDLEY